jgi:hypothetical protein
LRGAAFFTAGFFLTALLTDGADASAKTMTGVATSDVAATAARILDDNFVGRMDMMFPPVTQYNSDSLRAFSSYDHRLQQMLIIL